VRADQEISDNAAFSANTLHMRSKNFPGQQRALARGGHEPQLPIGDEFIELSGACERRTNFGQHALANYQPALPSGFAQPVLKNQRALPNW
jgi:hypothetical protein